MRDKQRLIRTLIEDIVADIDDDTGEIVLVVHWKGGRHTELRVKKPKTGEHNSRTSCHCTLINQILWIQGDLGRDCTPNYNISTARAAGRH